MPLAEAALPLLAGTVSTAFAFLVLRQYAERRRHHRLAWGVGLAFYALASLIEAYVALAGWTVPLYRVYFPVAGGLVGLLGAGTIYLQGRPRVGHVFAAVVGLLLLVATFGQFTVPLSLETPVGSEEAVRPLHAWGTELGGKAVPFPNAARIAFLTLNVVGGLALVVGALWSWWRTRAAGVLLIGLGALLPFMGGTFSTLGVVQARIVAQFLGIVVMFAGYLAGSAAARARAPAAPSAAR